LGSARAGGGMTRGFWAESQETGLSRVGSRKDHPLRSRGQRSRRGQRPCGGKHQRGSGERIEKKKKTIRVEY